MDQIYNINNKKKFWYDNLKLKQTNVLPVYMSQKHKCIHKRIIINGTWFETQNWNFSVYSVSRFNINIIA